MRYVPALALTTLLTAPVSGMPAVPNTGVQVHEQRYKINDFEYSLEPLEGGSLLLRQHQLSGLPSFEQGSLDVRFRVASGSVSIEGLSTFYQENGRTEEYAFVLPEGRSKEAFLQYTMLCWTVIGWQRACDAGRRDLETCETVASEGAELLLPLQEQILTNLKKFGLFR